MKLIFYPMPPIALLELMTVFSAVHLATSAEHHSQCRSLCATCQSLKPARINQICSVGLLTGCSCPENALNLTSATDGDSATRHSCPQLDKDAVGYCPHGQQTDPAGCPVALCRPAAGCAATSGCNLFCPSGFQTDSSGCPLCRCRCEYSAEARARCANACSAIGLSTFQLTAGGGDADSERSCPICVCQREATVATPSPPCLLRCPNSCGPHGFVDGESRDERGCVRDCSCRCPTQGRQACPGSESCLRWEIDRFGCQVCSACSSQTKQQQPAASSSCITKSSLQLPNAMERLCPSDCPNHQFSISEDSSTGCLTCTCNYSPVDSSSTGNRCSASVPICTNSCGPHGHLRDSRGCLLPGCPCSCPDLNACIARCGSTGGNFTVARDAYGCHACHCGSSATTGSGCPAEPPCSRSCGDYGFESDPVTGCRMSCRCRCPKRSCGCFYGSRQDVYGCDTCECVTASEYLQLLPF